MHDVARAAGVSQRTVSNVVNNYEYVRPQTRQRVLDAMAELGYVPNAAARTLRSARTGLGRWSFRAPRRRRAAG
ncbi:LacI family DNA-binding transcriptional regulator [Nonomuraea sp. CA-143628]|uniref:LacI family DNA-binding transcriptional regulator n=1 Tax=Nonomuraea sp. CA-143628 TaxID=3239997 RepID=UPI003D9338F7